MILGDLESQSELSVLISIEQLLKQLLAGNTLHKSDTDIKNTLSTLKEYLQHKSQGMLAGDIRDR